MKQLILMSDVINSGSKNQSLLMHDFKSLVNVINTEFEAHVLSPLTITLGDEFQGLIVNLESALKIILAIEEHIIENNFNFKLRYVLLYGEINTVINRDIAYEMLGEGLREARYRLNNMKTDASRFYSEIGNKTLDHIVNNSFIIYQQIVDKWDQDKDHALITSFIKWKDYKLVAEKLIKTRSQIWKREKTLQMSAYFATKEILNTVAEIQHQ